MGTILILGDITAGTEIANWLSQNEKIKVHLAILQDPDTVKNLNLSNNLELLRVSSKFEAEELVTQYAYPENFLITCYWPWILSRKSFDNYQVRTLNFHPALLPKDRGWYPHVHQVRNNLISGVTLHRLSENADEGEIWAQEEVKLPFPMTAGEARTLLQNRIIQLFKNKWSEIFTNQIRTYPQHGIPSYHTKASVEKYNILDVTTISNAEDVVRAIASRNIGKKSFIKIESDNGSKFVHIFFTNDGELAPDL